MSTPNHILKSYHYKKTSQYQGKITYLKGRKLTETDINEKVFRIGCGSLDSSVSLLLVPVDNTERAFELASCTLVKINPEGTLVMDRTIRNSLQVIEFHDNDENWITFDEAMSQRICIRSRL